MSNYYSREPGDEGEILTNDGEPPGVELGVTLFGGPMPVKAALGLVASLADIVTIAEEDRAVHGDISVSDVRVEPTGAVSLGGYGDPHPNGHAPESPSATIATDVYGLGLVLVAALSSDPPGPTPRDPEAHDDAIVGRIRHLDWGEMASRKWLDDVLSFLCAMLAFEPEERPAPLDVANVMLHIVGQIEGDGLEAWAARAVRAAGGGRATRPAAAPEPEEDLSGPASLSGPISGTAAFRIRKAASAKGESTAFWSREKIAAMLNEEDDDEPSSKGPVREAWTPPPSGPSTRPPAPPAAPPPVAAPPPLAAPPRPPPPAAPAAPPPRAAPMAAAPPLVQGPVASMGSADVGPPPKGSGSMVKIAIVAGVLLFLVVGCGVVGTAVYFLRSQSDTADATAPSPSSEQTATPSAEPAEPKARAPRDTGGAPAREETKPAAAPTKPAKPAAPVPSTPTRSSGSSTRTAPSAAPARSTTSAGAGSAPSVGTPATSSAPSVGTPAGSSTTRSGPFAVKFVVSGAETLLQCGDGQRAEFVGSTRLTFDSVTTCRIEVDGVRGVATASREGTITCTVGGGKVSCSDG